MKENILYLHSHSGIERTLKDKDIVNKSHVLVDEQFKDLFDDCAKPIKSIVVSGKKYFKVPILSFVNKGGIFKNLDR
jgi:hypothetical protein